MSEYSNDNKGVLYKNKTKQKDTHPDYKGSAVIDGKAVWLDAWIKTAGPTSKTPGEKFMSIAIKPKDAPAGAAPQTPATPAPAAKPADDDIAPF